MIATPPLSALAALIAPRKEGDRERRLPHRNRKFDVRYTVMTVEIFHRGQRVASHARAVYKVGGHTTIDTHRPKSHQRDLRWTPERLVRWVCTVGRFTTALAGKILQSRPHPERNGQENNSECVPGLGSLEYVHVYRHHAGHLQAGRDRDFTGWVRPRHLAFRSPAAADAVSVADE